VKILFDLYRQQITEGNLIPNIDLAWSESAYFQQGDNPGRKEPGTGEITTVTCSASSMARVGRAVRNGARNAKPVAE